MTRDADAHVALEQSDLTVVTSRLVAATREYDVIDRHVTRVLSVLHFEHNLEIAAIKKKKLNFIIEKTYFVSKEIK